jgi:predicted nucleic acid-binding protein
VKLLIAEDGSDQAHALAESLYSAGRPVIAPAWTWAEVGSVLRKKARAGELGEAELGEAWATFYAYPILYLDSAELREAAWTVAARFALPTLYDAAFLACVEIVAPADGEFWTADRAFIQQLGRSRPAYVRELGV